MDKFDQIYQLFGIRVLYALYGKNNGRAPGLSLATGRLELLASERASFTESISIGRSFTYSTLWSGDECDRRPFFLVVEASRRIISAMMTIAKTVVTRFATSSSED